MDYLEKYAFLCEKSMTVMKLNHVIDVVLFYTMFNSDCYLCHSDVAFMKIHLQPATATATARGSHTEKQTDGRDGLTDGRTSPHTHLFNSIQIHIKYHYTLVVFEIDCS